MATVASGFRAFAVAYFLMFKLYNDENPYPAFGAAKTLDLDWIIPIGLIEDSKFSTNQNGVFNLKKFSGIWSGLCWFVAFGIGFFIFRR